MNEFETNFDTENSEIMEEPIKKVTWGIKVPPDKKEQLDKIKELCGNGEDAADALIRSFKLMNAKVDHMDRQTEVERFALHINAIQDAFIQSLQTCDDMKELVTKAKDEIIESKEKNIAMWQEKARVNEEQTKQAYAALEEATEKQQIAENEAKQAKELQAAAEKTAADKVAIADMLQSKLLEAESKLIDYSMLKTSEADLTKKFERLQQEMKDTQKDAEITQERAIMALQKEMDKILADKAQEIAAIELKSERTLAILEKEKNQEIQKLRDKIEMLKDEKAELKELIAELRAKNVELLK